MCDWMHEIHDLEGHLVEGEEAQSRDHYTHGGVLRDHRTQLGQTGPLQQHSHRQHHGGRHDGSTLLDEDNFTLFIASDG